MIKSRPYPLWVFFLLLFLNTLVSHAIADAPFISISVDHDDGGRAGDQYMHDLVTALNANGCNAVSNAEPNNSQMLFDSRPVSIAKKDRTDYQLIARARTLNGELMVRGAILVQASTGIENLGTLRGELIGFVTRKSWSGYRMPLKTLNQAGIMEMKDKFSFAGNHVGAVSALLHKDVFATVTAEPLAKRWAEPNDLSIVAVSDAVETGGWWIHRSVSEKQIKNCAQALSKLERSQLKALPAWIDGFEIQ